MALSKTTIAAAILDLIQNPPTTNPGDSPEAAQINFANGLATIIVNAVESSAINLPAIPITGTNTDPGVYGHLS